MLSHEASDQLESQSHLMLDVCMLVCGSSCTCRRNRKVGLYCVSAVFFYLNCKDLEQILSDFPI